MSKTLGATWTSLPLTSLWLFRKNLKSIIGICRLVGVLVTFFWFFCFIVFFFRFLFFFIFCVFFCHQAFFFLCVFMPYSLTYSFSCSVAHCVTYFQYLHNLHALTTPSSFPPPCKKKEKKFKVMINTYASICVHNYPLSCRTLSSL